MLLAETCVSAMGKTSRHGQRPGLPEWLVREITPSAASEPALRLPSPLPCFLDVAQLDGERIRPSVLGSVSYPTGGSRAPKRNNRSTGE